MLKEFIGKTRFMGEVGLDGALEFKSHWEKQIQVFEMVLQVATQAGGRILTIHSRRAANEVVNMLAKHPSAGSFVLHWYSGNSRDLQRAIDLGCWFSVGPAMMDGKSGRSVVERIPRGKLLTESDGPFAQVKGNRAMPWDVVQAERTVAEVWGCDLQEATTMLSNNLNSLFRAHGLAARPA